MTGADVAHLLAYTRVRARSHMLALSSIHGRAPEFLSLQSAAPRCLTVRAAWAGRRIRMRPERTL